MSELVTSSYLTEAMAEFYNGFTPPLEFSRQEGCELDLIGRAVRVQGDPLRLHFGDLTWRANYVARAKRAQLFSRHRFCLFILSIL